MPKGVYTRHSGQYADRKKQDPIERFISKIEFTETCWLWKGSPRNETGYGCFWFEGRTEAAHIFAYKLWVGSTIKGLVIDHLCRVHMCVNPDHLEQVTNLVNIQRGEVGRWERDKTHCRLGHPYDEANTYYQQAKYGPKRQCRKCKALAAAKWRAIHHPALY